MAVFPVSNNLPHSWWFKAIRNHHHFLLPKLWITLVEVWGPRCVSLGLSQPARRPGSLQRLTGRKCSLTLSSHSWMLASFASARITSISCLLLCLHGAFSPVWGVSLGSLLVIIHVLLFRAPLENPGKISHLRMLHHIPRRSSLIS